MQRKAPRRRRTQIANFVAFPQATTEESGFLQLKCNAYARRHQKYEVLTPASANCGEPKKSLSHRPAMFLLSITVPNGPPARSSQSSVKTPKNHKKDKFQKSKSMQIFVKVSFAVCAGRFPSCVTRTASKTCGLHKSLVELPFPCFCAVPRQAAHSPPCAFHKIVLLLFADTDGQDHHPGRGAV